MIRAGAVGGRGLISQLRGTWVVVPSYNEGAVIAATICNLLPVCPNVVVVDDGSTDDTAERSAAAGATVVRHPVNLGQGAALMTGVRYALDQGASFVVTFDADGQHRADDIIRMLAAALQSGAEVVLGSRFLESSSDIPPARAILLRLATLYTRLSTGLPLTDAHNGLRLLTRAAAQRLRIRQNRMAHASEILDWIASSRATVTEVPVRVAYTAYSIAKGQTAWSSLGILWDLWSLKLHR
jgi:glycosyltransferase involved in cell wall biosynthesis